MITVTTTNDKKDHIQVAEENSYLVKEGDFIMIKNSYGQRNFKKTKDGMQLVLR